MTLVAMAIIENTIGLLDSLPRCSQCTEIATRAHVRGGDRYCDAHGADAPEYPRAPWVRALQQLLRGHR